MNDMIMGTRKSTGKVAYVPCPTEQSENVVACLKKCVGESDNIEKFTAGNMPLEKLPEEVAQKVRNALKEYDLVSVIYELGAFHVYAGKGNQIEYSSDRFFCGMYAAWIVYPEDESRRLCFNLYDGLEI